MPEYISREKTLALLKNLGSRDYRREKGTIQDAIKMISSSEYTPTADVAPVRHGRWETRYRSGTTVSKGVVSGCCDMWNGWKTPYCPNCGAKMDGETESNDG